jgi:hypothetical protein
MAQIAHFDVAHVLKYRALKGDNPSGGEAPETGRSAAHITPRKLKVDPS